MKIRGDCGLLDNGRKSVGETLALRPYHGLYTYEIQLGLYIWNPALYRIHRVRAWHQILRHVWLPRGRRSSAGSIVQTFWSSFRKPTRNRSLSVLLPVWGEKTGGNRFHTKGQPAYAQLYRWWSQLRDWKDDSFPQWKDDSSMNATSVCLLPRHVRQRSWPLPIANSSLQRRNAKFARWNVVFKKMHPWMLF